MPEETDGSDWRRGLTGAVFTDPDSFILFLGGDIYTNSVIDTFSAGLSYYSSS
jgi:hypothetical protein